ncbi:MAG: pencillin-binding transpeptidase [Schlesneria sp.]|nr:pencillin-binding transpeptidase [Schlesneria sp.]
MDSIHSAIGWCALQVSLVSLVAVVIATLIGRRSPFAACSVVCVATVVCTALTFVAPLPVHRCFTLPGPRSSAVTATTPDAVVTADESATTRNDLHQDSSTLPTIDLRAVALSLRSLVLRIERIEQRGNFVRQWVTWLLLATIAFGILRLVAGIAFVRRARRKGVPITDPKLLSSLRELSSSLGCRVIPDLRANGDFTDAAVAGWIRPTLILPGHWQDWTDDEQRAVLAHELAHLVRRDTVWRATAASLLAVHFYNPAIHWLMRRVMLYQELSADALAAMVIGRRSYLRSLSSLAIRHDDQLWRKASPDILPVFSGHLIRRIKVLHSTDGRSEMGTWSRRNIASTMISTALVLMAVAAVATRGIAQPPGGEPKAAAGPIKRVSTTKVIPEYGRELDPTQAMFRRAPLDPAVIGSKNPYGLMVVRLQEILRRPQLQVGTPAINGLLSMWLAEELKSPTPPPVAFETIEWFATIPVIKFWAETEGKKSQFALGTQEFAFRLSQPIDLNQWVQQYAPNAKCHVVENRNVYEFAVPSAGTGFCLVWAANESTIRGTISGKEITPETRLAELDFVPKPKPADPSEVSPTESADEGLASTWPATWNRIDRGLGSITMARADLKGLITDLDHKPDLQTDSMKAIGRAVRSVMSRCATSSIAFDMTDATSEIGIRASFAHPSKESATESAQDIREILTLSKAELAKQVATLKADNTEDAIELALVKLYDTAIQIGTVSVDEYEDKSAAVVFAFAIPLDRLVEFVVQSMKDSPAP